jgi:hypothetical protein
MSGSGQRGQAPRFVYSGRLILHLGNARDQLDSSSQVFMPRR